MPDANDQTKDVQTKDVQTFEIAQTAADQAILLRWVTRQPSRLAIQAATFGFLWLSFMAMQLAIGLLNALFSTRHALLEAGRDYLARGFGEDLRMSAPIFTGFVVVLAVVNVLVLIPRQCRLLGARIMGAYPAPPGESPAAALVSRLRLDDRGVESAAAAERVFVAWPLVKRLVETRRHMFLMTGTATGFVVPKTSLDGPSLDRFRDAVERRLARDR